MDKQLSHLHFGNVILKSSSKSIYFSMGCFWYFEPLFWSIKGVVFTEVGYSNCTIENPSCSDAFRENIVHREVVCVVYDDLTINKKNLLSTFFKNHTIDKRENFPVPSLYKSGVFVTNKEDYDFSSFMLEEEERERKSNNNNCEIATSIEYMKNYREADEHHQQYALKNKTYSCKYIK